jgi:succinate dehydrogenase / fumarate reductase cytochrome b subunit
MALKRNVGLAAALRYQGRGPMLAYILHRVGGLAIVLFVAVHILASLMGGKTGVFLNTIYENWLFQIFIYFFALFHAINGLRIVILDLWPKLLEYQREALWLEWFVFLPTFGMAALVMVNAGLGG